MAHLDSGYYAKVKRVKCSLYVEHSLGYVAM